LKQDDENAIWRIASYCDSNGCVAVAKVNDEILLRDSKAPDGPVLRFSRAEWSVFLAGVRAGEFD
jgi:hypothetical protein